MWHPQSGNLQYITFFNDVARSDESMQPHYAEDPVPHIWHGSVDMQPAGPESLTTEGEAQVMGACAPQSKSSERSGPPKEEAIVDVTGGERVQAATP